MARVSAIVLVLLAASLAGVYFAGGPGAVPPRHSGTESLVLAATVDRVIDGDSIAVTLDSGPMEVRLHGADAPEWKQPFGREAKAKLSRILHKGEAIELLPVDQDRYDRMVAVVYEGGRSLNEALIAEGFAWAYRDYLGQLDGDGHYCELEAQARSAHRGLWSQARKLWVPPWIYRQRRRSRPGARVPSRDYSQETAADCMAAMKRSRLGPLPPASDRAARQQSGPTGCRIKGNINLRGEKIYHLPGDRDYDRTRIDLARGERWFCSEEQARQAGWRAVRSDRG